MMKKTGGILDQIKKEGNVVNYSKDSGLTLEKLMKFNTDMDEAKTKPLHVYMSIDMGQYFHATMSGDEVKASYYEHKFWRTSAEGKLSDYKRIKEQYSFITYQTVLLLDRKYKRRSGLDWYIEDVKIGNDYWGESSPVISMRDGLFSVNVHLDDDSGYDYYCHELACNITATELIELLINMRSRAL